MINRCIGCYYHDSKENVCTHGSPIFLDDTCTDYQDNEFVKQIRADAIEEMFSKIDELAIYYAGDKDGNPITPKMLVKEDVIKLLEQLKQTQDGGKE